jgi:hypothetical protein
VGRATAEEIEVLLGHEGEVTWADFSPDELHSLLAFLRDAWKSMTNRFFWDLRNRGREVEPPSPRRRSSQ